MRILMHNWRATIGFMLPSSCLVFEQEFQEIVRQLEGVVGVSSRLLIESCDYEGLQQMNEAVEKAARELRSCNCDLIVYMCTSGSFMDGGAGEAELRDQIKAVVGKPVLTTSGSVLAALGKVQAKSVVMLTPYDEDLTRKEITWLEENGIQVIEHHYRDIPDNLDRGALFPEANFHAAQKLNWEEADAIFLSCANVRTLEIVEKLERHTGKPVVTSSLATTWNALRSCDIHEPLIGLGKLFQNH